MRRTGSIRLSYAHGPTAGFYCLRRGQARGVGCLGSNARLKPSEIAVEILGGDAAMATKEGLEPLMRLLTVWMCSSPGHARHSRFGFSGLMADAHRGGARADNWLAAVRRRSKRPASRLAAKTACKLRRRTAGNMALTCAGCGRGHQDRKLFMATSPFDALPGAPCGPLRIEFSFTFTLLKTKRLVRPRRYHAV